MGKKILYKRFEYCEKNCQKNKGLQEENDLERNI